MERNQRYRIEFEEGIRRIGEVVIASVAIIFLLPLAAICAVLVAIDSPGPVLYHQKRVGYRGKQFFIYKFRTMVRDADMKGPEVTARDDNRITRIGHYLRRLKIDELPQLFNVVRGDMSFVGPRPQVPKYVQMFPEKQRNIILSVRPGITCPTTLQFRDEESLLAGVENREEFYLRHLLPRKCDMDVDYVIARSLRKDFVVLFETVAILFKESFNRLMTATSKVASRVSPSDRAVTNEVVQEQVGQG